MSKPITPQQLDRILEGKPRPPGPRILWTLPAIAHRIGTGVDFVRNNLSKQVGTPVRRSGGRWYCFEDELIEFLRRGGVG